MSARATLLSIFEQLKDKVILQHLDLAFFWCDFEILSFALEVCLLLWEYDLATSNSLAAEAVATSSGKEKKERSRTHSSADPPSITTNSRVTLMEQLVQWQENANKLLKMLSKYTKVFVAAKPRWLRFTSAVKNMVGHPKAAQRGWQKALDSADKLGMAYECGVIRLFMGRALTGESDKRKKYLELAMQVFARNEKGYYLSWCEEELNCGSIGGDGNITEPSSTDTEEVYPL